MCQKGAVLDFSTFCPQFFFFNTKLSKGDILSVCVDMEVGTQENERNLQNCSVNR